MKTISKLFMPIIMFVITLTNLHPALAQRPDARQDAAAIIHHTRIVIEEAQKAVAQGRVYTGDLSRSISHQHQAVRLYNQGLYAGAINHSITSRNFAFDAIRANKAEIRAEWQFDEREQNYARSLPTREQMEKEAHDAKIDEELRDDRAVTIRYTDLDVVAPPPPPPAPAPVVDMRADAQYVIHRTRLVIEEGQRIVSQGRVFTGDLPRAIAHQHLAMNLFNQGNYQGSINHSMTARNFAFDAIRANKAEIRAEWMWDEREQNYSRSLPAREQMEREAHDARIDEDLRDDRATSSTYTDMDVVYDTPPAPRPAPPPPPPAPAPQPNWRDDAQYVIHRTRLIIEEGQRIVAQGRIFTGDLPRAVAHQHMAMNLFNQGNYQGAINHSMTARQFTFDAIRANKAEIRAEWQWDQREQSYARSLPAREQMEREAHDAKVDEDLRDDRATSATYNDLDVVYDTPPTPRPSPQPDMREDAKGIIHHTRVVIEEGQRIVAQGRVYTGDITASISHQHQAIWLFNHGQYARAINQSIRSRNLAFAAIRANKAEIRAEWQLDERENRYARTAPADADLDKEVRDSKVDMGLNDQRAATIHYTDLDVM